MKGWGYFCLPLLSHFFVSYYILDCEEKQTLTVWKAETWITELNSASADFNMECNEIQSLLVSLGFLIFPKSHKGTTYVGKLLYFIMPPECVCIRS